MGENGKRSRHRRDYDGDSKNQKRRTDRDRDRDRDRDEKGGDDELIVYRILCPDGFIGSVIGKSGKVINSIRQETKARVKVVDPFPGAKDRVITIYCYVKDKEDVEIDEEFDDGEPLCPAQDALIKVHNAIAEAIDSFGDSDKKWKDKEECKILVPSSQSANIIGKSGSTIKRLRSKTRATIKVNPKDATDPTHSCAMEFDNFLVEHGDVGPLWKSLGKSWSFSSRSLKITLPSGWPKNPTAPMVQNLKLKHNLLVSKLKFKTADKKVLAENVKWTTKFERLGSTDACMAVGDYFFKQNTLAQKPQMNEITGDPEAVKKALFAISAIMYKFAPKEEIPLDTNVPEALPNIIIPSDAPIFPPGGLYPGLDPRSVPSMLGAAGIPEFPGYSDTGSAWPVYSSALPVVSGYGGTSRSGELVVRILCPSNTIGRVIGKGGSSIKNVRQASGACVDVDDTKANRGECIITVTSTESTDDLKSVAVEAVLLLQGKINDDEDDDTVSIRLLVPSKVIGCIIGKSGSIINEIRKRTKADIHISKGEKPKCADANDELVEVVGKVGSVRDALVQIVLRLRDDVLKDRDRGHNQSAGADSYYSGGTGLSAHSVLPSVPPVAPVGYEHRDEAGSGLGMRSSSSLYGYGSLSVADDGYGSLPSYSSKLYGGLPPPSTLEMVVPGHAVGKVMGKGGANIGNIRKISGAVVEISESKSSRGDRVAVISGTPEQKRAAENLIQAFIMAT